jgi:5-methylcytosine-specific restriction endonuclease McrA
MAVPELRGCDNLQVHHLRARTKLGDDALQNLITLRAECHAPQHRNSRDLVPIWPMGSLKFESVLI